MRFLKEASKLVTNKYFLYVIVVLSAMNILGYLVTNKLNAVILFGLISLLGYHFSKNFAVILLVAMVVTNLVMSNKMMREGLENNKDDMKEAVEKLGDIDPELKKGVDATSSTKNVSDAKEKLKTDIEAKKNKETPVITDLVDPNNPDMNKPSTESFTLEGAGSSNSKKPSTKNGSRIDYMSTIEASYDNLDKMLGSDGINKLTTDTGKLMAQQQKLFDSMQTMAPMLENAKSMLEGFDLKSLGGLAGLASSLQLPQNGPVPAPTK